MRQKKKTMIKPRALVDVANQNEETITTAWILMPDVLALVFQKLLISLSLYTVCACVCYLYILFGDLYFSSVNIINQNAQRPAVYLLYPHLLLPALAHLAYKHTHTTVILKHTHS